MASYHRIISSTDAEGLWDTIYCKSLLVASMSPRKEARLIRDTHDSRREDTCPPRIALSSSDWRL